MNTHNSRDNLKINKLRGILIVLTALALSLAVAAQSPKPKPKPKPTRTVTEVDMSRRVVHDPDCDLGLDKAPSLRGLKLWMSEAEANDLLGRRLGFVSVTNDFTRWAAVAIPRRVAGFEGVEFISLSSFNSKLLQIRVQYDIRFKDLNEFAYNFIPKLNLPMNGWKPTQIDGVQLTCKEFDVVLTTRGGDSWVQLTDTIALSKLRDEMAKAEAAKKAAIKP
jgi:hypothetical protein